MEQNELPIFDGELQVPTLDHLDDEDMDLTLDPLIEHHHFRHRSGHLHWLDLPTKSIDQWTTCVSLQAICKSSTPAPPSLLIDDPMLIEQSTWIMPSVQNIDKPPSLITPSWVTESYTSQVRNMLKSAGGYIASSLASPLVTLVLAPLLAHRLSITEYGMLAVLNISIALGSGLTQFGLAAAFFRYYTTAYGMHKERLALLSTLVCLLGLLLLPITLPMLLLAPWFSTLLLNSNSFAGSIRLAALLIICQNLTVPGFAWLRAENRSFLFITLSLLHALVLLGGTIILVGVMRLGINGALLAVGTGYAIVAFCTLPVLLPRVRLQVNREAARMLLTAGLPNVASFLSIWVLQLADRYMLAQLGSLQETGIYSVAYSVGGALSIFVISPLLLAWPTTLFTLAERADAAPAFRRIFRWYFILLFFSAYLLSLCGIIILHIFFPPTYYEAMPIIPLITLSIAIYGLYHFFMLVTTAHEKSWLTLALTASGALFNIGINCIFIPLWGPAGAAISTIATYSALTIAIYVVNRRFSPVPYETGKCLAALATGIGLYMGCTYLLHIQTPWLWWCIQVAALLLYGGYLLALGKTSR